MMVLRVRSLKYLSSYLIFKLAISAFYIHCSLLFDEGSLNSDKNLMKKIDILHSSRFFCLEVIVGLHY